MARRNNVVRKKQPGIRKGGPKHPVSLPPAFFDSIREKRLTKLQLGEQWRRHKAEAEGLYDTRKRLLTRCGNIQWKQEHSRVSEILQNYSEGARQRLQQLASEGGPDLTDLRGFVSPVLSFIMHDDPEQPRRKKDAQLSTVGHTKTTGPYKLEFQQHLTENGICVPGHVFADGTKTPKPANKDAIMKMLNAKPDSVELSEAEFDRFCEVSDGALAKPDVMQSVIPLIEGPLDAKEHTCSSCNVKFTNLDQLTVIKLPASQPNRYHGSRPEGIHEKVREALGGHIVPSKIPHFPCVPNFFLGWKHQKSTTEVITEACYNGCLGARGMQSLRSFNRQEPTCDNNAYTLTCTYREGALVIYSIHCFRPQPHGQINYAMTRLGAWHLLGSVDSYRQGVLAYRNALAWAREQREQAIQMANETISELNDEADD